MKTNYVLIDYENVQPRNLSLLAAEHFRVLVFIGAQQQKLPVELVTAMQALGTRAEYVQIHGNGPNALDFHIAYYMGSLSAPDAFFHIISRDTGFDPLIAHLKARGIGARRSASLEGIPVLRALTTAPRDEQVEAVVDKLRGMPRNRPLRDKTLRSTIANWFGGRMDDAGVARIVEELVKRKAVSIAEGKVKYDLPA